VSVIFSEAHEDLRRTVRDFLRDTSPPAEVRRLMETPAGYDTALWRRMADELGLQGLAVPEEYGGAGAGPVELGIVMEEMGRSLFCAPFLSTAVLAVFALTDSDDGIAQAMLLPGIAVGEIIATLAVAESAGSWDLGSVAATAELRDGRWLLSGTKMFVTDGLAADVILVAARTGEGLGLFAVRGTASGVRRTALATLDQTRRQARIDLAEAEGVPVGGPGDGTPALERVLDRAVAVLAAEQVGGARQVLETAAGYARTRVQFGRPIGSFQAVKHKLADMLVEVESAGSAAYRALEAAAGDVPPDDLPEIASIAKAYCSDAYAHVAAESIQIHGGIGFTWEHSAHLYLKRARSDRQLLGDPGYHLARLARLLEQLYAAA